METRERLYYEVYYRDLQEVIREEYKKYDFNICQSMGWFDGNVYSIVDIRKDDPYFEHASQSITHWQSKISTIFPIHTIMIDLCKKNLIPEGNYLVEVY